MKQFNGVYPAIVIDNADPDNIGRVKVRLPCLGASDEEGYATWARIATLMAGNNRGTWFIPDVNDEVLISFEGGDPSRPYVIGCLWNGNDKPPESMDGIRKNNRKVLRSRSGVKITLDETDGQEQLILETPGGQRITMKDGPSSLEIIDSNGNSVKLETSGVTITTSAKVTINASTAEISAGMLTVNPGLSKFSGVVQCDTLISNSVISASYTPGAGNTF